MPDDSSSSLNGLPKTGAALLHDLQNLQIIAYPMIEDFIFEKTAWMLYSEPGLGKSTLLTQMALALSSGQNLFGSLKVTRPYRVYYLMMEGSYEEQIDRIRSMQKSLTVCAENLWIDYTLAGINVIRQRDADFIIERIASQTIPEVLIIDPIYMMVGGGLKDSDTATAFAQYSSRLMRTFGCTNIFGHHSHRISYHQGVKTEEDDPYFGSTFLKAHLDVNYRLTALDANKKKVVMRNTKTRATNVQSRWILNYDPDTNTNFIEKDASKLDATQRILNFIKSCREAQKTTDIYEIMAECEVALAHMKRLAVSQTIMDVVMYVKHPSQKTLWVPKGMK